MDEAERTVWRTPDGSYKDLNQEKRTAGESRPLPQEELDGILSGIRLRYYLTPGCNLECSFCSNEGLGYGTKRNAPAGTDLIKALGDMVLQTTPVRAIDFGGGEPLMHPDFAQHRYELVQWARTRPDVRFAIHTNGTLLSPAHTDMISGVFSRIGISMHAADMETWSAMTDPQGKSTAKDHERRFRALQENLEYLSSKHVGEKVFLKAVIMRGVNDTERGIREFLETCNRYGFRPKFLQFEPQYAHQRDLIVGREELLAKLEAAGCDIPPGTPREHDPTTYCPTITFSYQGGLQGTHSIIGCGETGACVACHTYICIYVKPTDDGAGIYIKPCSVLDTRFDLTHAVRTGDGAQLRSLIKASREYLALAPGLGSQSWNKERR